MSILTSIEEPSSSSQMKSIQDLPEESLLAIFGHLGVRDMCKVEQGSSFAFFVEKGLVIVGHFYLH